MKQEVKTRAEFIQRIVFIVYCLVCAGAMIALLITGYTTKKIALGSLFILAAVFHIAEFHHHYKDKVTGSIFFVLSALGIVLGLVTLTISQLEIWTICLMFGIMDLFSGVVEIFTYAVILKKTCKTCLNLIDYAISVADIIFGILLIIELESGFSVHIGYLTAVFLVNAAVSFVKIISKNSKHE